MRVYTGYPGLHPGLQGVAATRLLTVADHYFLSFIERGKRAAAKFLVKPLFYYKTSLFHIHLIGKQTRIRALAGLIFFR
jgi:hypothetical protein